MVLAMRLSWFLLCSFAAVLGSGRMSVAVALVMCLNAIAAPQALLDVRAVWLTAPSQWEEARARSALVVAVKQGQHEQRGAPVGGAEPLRCTILEKRKRKRVMWSTYHYARGREQL